MTTQRVEWAGLGASRPDIAGIAEQTLTQRTPNRGGGSLDGVRGAFVIAINEIPQFGDGSATVGRGHAPRAMAGEILNKLAARDGPGVLVGVHRAQDRPLGSLGQIRHNLPW